MDLTGRLRDLVLEFSLPEPDYGLIIRGIPTLLAYPDAQVALTAAPLQLEGWQLIDADLGSEVSLRSAIQAVARALGYEPEVAAAVAQPQVQPDTAPALTAEQRSAVRHQGGRPARVLAGAGTGKTRVIVERFHHLVREGAAPDRILVLTFSRPAAAQLRGEILKGLTAVSRLWVSTFHSFCLRLLTEERRQAPALLHELEARAILAGLCPGKNSREIEELHAFIGQAKDQLLAPAQIRGYAAAAGDARLAAMADLYDQFQAELTAKDQAEFADFIDLAVQLLRADDLAAARWQGRFDHILVDEFQDTNSAQYEVLRSLTARHGNLFVVGDDDQAIYRFRGATDQYMRHLPDLLPNVADYPVLENFRCPAPVIAAANRLIARNAPDRVAKELFTTTRLEGFPPVRHWTARTDREEADAVATEIARRVRSGRSPADFAILLRSVRRSGGEFARALTERGIPCRTVGEEAPHPAVTQTLALLRYRGAREGQDLLTVLAGLVGPAELYAYVQGKATPEAVTRVEQWVSPTDAFNPAELVYEALLFLGHLKVSLQPTAAERARIAAVRSLTEAAAQATSLEALLTSALPGSHAAAADGVTIMTVHAAKGLQFPVVFVGALAEGRFPADVAATSLFSTVEAVKEWEATGTPKELTPGERLAQHVREERRLAYVALTRAGEELILTRALTYAGEEAQPSRFLLECGAPAPEEVSGWLGDATGGARAYILRVAGGAELAADDRLTAAVHMLQADPAAVPVRRQAAPTPYTPDDSLRLSVSALESYRRCPRQYYYASVLGLRDEGTVYTAFGEALHGALEDFNRARIGRGAHMLPWSDLEAYWDARMQPDPFESDAQYRQLKERGRLFLRRYYDWAATVPHEVISVEGKFEFPYEDHQGRRHTVTGRYDLIIRNAAGQEEIIDYKSTTREKTEVNKTRRGDPLKAPDRKLQLGVYYLARHGGRVVPGAKAGYVFLRHDDDKPPRTMNPALIPGDQVISCEHTEQTLQVIRTDINELIEAILANRFEPSPEERKCSMCAFKDPCEVSRRGYY